MQMELVARLDRTYEELKQVFQRRNADVIHHLFGSYL